MRLLTIQEANFYYRGQRIDTQEWVYGFVIIRKDRFYIATSDNIDFMTASLGGHFDIKLIEVIPDTVGGYSTVNDMNDIKVFAGDIIENIVSPEAPFSQIHRNIVVFEDGNFYAEGVINIETYDFEYCRVIGNVYDNPELLSEPIEIKDQLPVL